MEEKIREFEKLIKNNEASSSKFIAHFLEEDIFMLLNKSEVIKEYLISFLKKDKYTEDELVKKYGEFLGNALVVLATHLNKIKPQEYDYLSDFANLSGQDIFFDSIRDIPILDKELTIKYINLFQQYKKLYEESNDPSYKKKYVYYQHQVMEGNIRLVVSVAHKYQKYGFELMELVNEGSIGMIKAIERYDSSLGFAFSTYATYWISQAIMRSINDNSRVIRIPTHQQELFNKMNYAKKTLIGELGREPNLKEIAEYMNLPEKRIQELIKTFAETESLDAPLDKDETGELTFYNFVATGSFESEVLDRDLLNNLLKALNKKELEVIKLRYFNRLTLEETGKRLGVTRERIRQIEGKALKKMKKYSEAKYISLFDMFQYPKEEILKNISKLDISEQEYLYKTFGVSLTKKVSETSIDKTRILPIIEKLQSYYVNKTKSDITRVSISHFSGCTLKEILKNKNLSDKELEVCINYIWVNLKIGSKVEKLMHASFGELGNMRADFSKLSNSEVDYLVNYLFGLVSKLKNKDYYYKIKKSKYEVFNNKSITEISGLSMEQIKDLFAKIGYTSRFSKCAIKIFGTNFNYKLNLNIVTFQEIEYFYNTILELSKAYKTDNIYFRKTLEEVLGFNIPFDIRTNPLLQKAFGPELSFIYLGNLCELEEARLQKMISKYKIIYGKGILSDVQINEEIINILPIKYRNVLGLYLIYNYSIEDISLALNIRLCAAKSILDEGLLAFDREKNYNEEQFIRQRTKYMI